jgi:hypothetical protein
VTADWGQLYRPHILAINFATVLYCRCFSLIDGRKWLQVASDLFCALLTHTHTHTHTLTYVHNTHTHKLTHTLTYVHTYTHTHTLRYTVLQYTPLHYITLQYTPLHYIILHFITLHHVHMCFCTSSLLSRRFRGFVDLFALLYVLFSDFYLHIQSLRFSFIPTQSS